MIIPLLQLNDNSVDSRLDLKAGVDGEDEQEGPTHILGSRVRRRPFFTSSSSPFLWAQLLGCTIIGNICLRWPVVQVFMNAAPFIRVRGGKIDMLQNHEFDKADDLRVHPEQVVTGRAAILSGCTCKALRSVLG